MKLDQLIDYWDRHARGRLADSPMTVKLSEADKRKLDALAYHYPLKSREALLRDMLGAAMNELETSFPYREGSAVVARDEDGFEIYEDVGLTPRFLKLIQKHMKNLKQRLSSVA